MCSEAINTKAFTTSMHFPSSITIPLLASLAIANPWGPPNAWPPHLQGPPQTWSFGPPRNPWGPACPSPSSAAYPTSSRPATTSPSASTTPTPPSRPQCVVNGLGGGQDDGPNILAAFQQCKNGGKVVLADYYSVDTLLLVTDLQDVEIELSGTREFSSHYS